MHDEEGPRRLRQGADTPEPLLRALTALRKGVDDSARLERVGQKMDAALRTPPSAAPRGPFGQKLSALKLIVAGIGLLAPVLFFQLMDDVTTVPPSDRQGSPLPSAAPTNTENSPPALAMVEPPGAEPTVAPELTTDAPKASNGSTGSTSSTSSTSSTRRAPRSQPRKQRDRAETTSGPAGAAVHTEPSKAAGEATEPQPARPRAEAEATPTPTPAARIEPKPAAPKPATLKPVTPKPVPTEDAPRLSEAELLLKARKALKQDPELALRLASEHQSLYANGRLTPEREVLLIEALRQLGRKHEADERLQKFEARYPSSIHLKRLREAR